jgi:hypothetical protein
MNDNFDLDLTDVEKVAEQQSTNEVVSADDDDDSTAHKVVFYIVMALLGLSGVGIPILIWLLIKKSKQLKQTKKELEAAKANQATTEVKTETKTEEVKQEETKTPETEQK